jgi:hypothetical protein
MDSDLVIKNGMVMTLDEKFTLHDRANHLAKKIKAEVCHG